MNPLICESIHNKNILTFSYDGGKRNVEPHCYGRNTKGNEVLRAFQTGGYSSSGNPIGWRLYKVRNMKNIAVSSKSFEAPRPRYNPKDRSMVRIYCNLKEE